MGQIGHFGKVKFFVKTTDAGKPKIQSFTNMQWETSINVEEHRRHGKKPLLENTSRNADVITLDLYFLTRFNVDPWKMLLKLRKYNLKGKVYPLNIGGRKIGSFKFIITHISNGLKTFDGKGNTTGVVCSVTFTEYPYNKASNKKKKTIASSSSKTSGKSSSGSSSNKKSTSKNSGGYISYTVKAGDTLWGLATKYYGDGTKYMKIYNANKTAQSGFNKITNPSLIITGWKIKIPT